MTHTNSYAAFAGDTLLRAGPLTDVLSAVKLALDAGDSRSILIFEDQSGQQVDFDFRGSLDDVLERARPSTPPKGPGRPKLGVESREVSLLPRHWAWLQSQRGGGSAALRRLVEEASRRDDSGDRARRRSEAAYRFMSAMAGNRAGFEEASRALFAADMARVKGLAQQWPADIAAHLAGMLADGDEAAGQDADHAAPANAG